MSWIESIRTRNLSILAKQGWVVSNGQRDVTQGSAAENNYSQWKRSLFLDPVWFAHHFCYEDITSGKANDTRYIRFLRGTYLEKSAKITHLLIKERYNLFVSLVEQVFASTLVLDKIPKKSTRKKRKKHFPKSYTLWKKQRAARMKNKILWMSI